MVAVVVSVAIAVFVAISVAAGIDSVKYDCHVLELVLGVQCFKLGYHAAFHDVGAYKEEGAVGVLFVGGWVWGAAGGSVAAVEAFAYLRHASASP